MMQGDELAAWLRARAGKLTASRMRDAMAFKKNGEPTEARSKLLRELLAERVTGDSVRHYVTDAMAWGLEREEEAKAAYEAHTGLLVRDAGFYDHPRIDNLGATPDGLVNSDGLVETKCPTTATFLEWTLTGAVPEEHKPQMIVQIACTGRRWCDFVAFDPRVRDRRRQLFVRRFEPSAEEIAAVEAAAVQFLRELDAMFELFTQAAA
jgi:exodeoxyribonuclease (lambda-induced)